jgi:hypothetical protein
MSDRPTLAVVYERGAVSTPDLAALGDLATIAFLVPESAYTTRLRPVLDQLGPVVTLTGDTAADLARVRRLAPAGITTFSDAMLRVTARLAAGLGLPFHDVGTTLLLTDKSRQRGRLRDAGVDSVRCLPVTAPDEWWRGLAEVGLPAVVKPAFGGGSRDTHLVRDHSTAGRLFGELVEGRPGPVELVVEEYLPGRDLLPFGDYVGVETLCLDGVIRHFAVTGKFPLVPPFREPGQFWPVPIGAGERAEVMALATAALRALGVRDGFTHTEIKLGPAGPRIIEVNGRLAGNLQQFALLECGVDLVRIGAQVALGQPVRLEPLRHSGFFFQYSVMGPTEPGRLEAVHGIRELRGTEGVAGYRSLVRPGDHLPGGVVTAPLDLLWGRAADSAGMFDVLDRALAPLRFEFSLDGGGRSTLTPQRPWTAATDPKGGPFVPHPAGR